MQEKVLTYEGKDIVVQYGVHRCIHAAECVRGLPDVFDPDRRPWIDSDQAPAAAIAEVVLRCPTGALHARRRDGIDVEPVPDHNTVTLGPNGPLFLRGEIEIVLADGTVLLKDTRVALCRCGASKNKPFCDNSHAEAGFQDEGILRTVQVKPEKEGRQSLLRVQPSRNGPLLVQGPLEIRGVGTSVRGGQATFCRCGGSGNKPFCDGTHNRIGFSSG